MRRISRPRKGFSIVAATGFWLVLAVGSMSMPRSAAALCADPAGDGVTASDSLFVLNASIGLAECEACECDVDDSGAVTASDALITLQAAVGGQVELRCPACSGSTTTSSTTTSTTTTTSLLPTTSTSTTTLGGGGFPLPKDRTCLVSFRAGGAAIAKFVLFDVRFDAVFGDFVRGESTLNCVSLTPGDSTVGVDGDDAPGHAEISYFSTLGTPLPTTVVACAFVASVGGLDTSIFDVATVRATNPLFQPIAVQMEIAGAACGND